MYADQITSSVDFYPPSQTETAIQPYSINEATSIPNNRETTSNIVQKHNEEDEIEVSRHVIYNSAIFKEEKTFQISQALIL